MSFHTRKSGQAALTGALLLSTALFLPGARAQTPPPPPAAPADAPAMTPAETTPATTPAEAAPEAAPEASTPADDSSKKDNRFRIGPTIGFFLPSDSKTRDRFGSSWFALGLGIGPVSGVTSKGTVGFDINLLYQQHDGNHALIVPIGVGYRVALTKDTTAKSIPYAGITADYYIVNFKSNPENINGTYGAGGGSALLGINFGNTANVEARYQFASKTRGFDFSGLNLTAGYRF